MKKEYKVYLLDEDLKLLKAKAEELGLVGRGWLTHYLERLSKEKIVLLDKNLKEMLSVLNLKPT